MSTLSEIEEAVETLPAAEQRRLLRFLAACLEEGKSGTADSRTYRIQTQPGGILPGIDPDKLGQLPEDY